MLFWCYSADLTPLPKYIVHQLYAGQTTEIVVLRELSAHLEDCGYQTFTKPL